MPEGNKHLLGAFQEITFLEAMERSGCPLCFAVWQRDSRLQPWYVNEGPTDERTLARIQRSLGFCGWHMVTLALFEGDAAPWSHLGSALLAEEVMYQHLLPILQSVLPAGEKQDTSGRMGALKLARLRWRLHPKGQCPACQDTLREEREQLTAFANLLAAHPAFCARYCESDGLCLPHLLQVTEQWHAHAPPQALPDLLAALIQPIQRQLLLANELLTRPGTPLGFDKAIHLLFGANTHLWVAHRSRLALQAYQESWHCAACASVHEQMVLFLKELLTKPLLPHLCDWHGWFFFQLASSEPEGLAGVLSRTIRARLGLLGSAQTARAGFSKALSLPQCAACIWLQRQEPALIVAWWKQISVSHQKLDQVKLCFPHGRCLLEAAPSRTASQQVVSILWRNARQLAEQLRSYIAHCPEAKQAMMQPQERQAWQECTRWLGGLPATQMLTWLAATLLPAE
jgi:hypothetical protein